MTYEVVYKPDSLVSEYNTEHMTLKHFDKKSYFYNETKFQLDSIYDRVTAEFLKTGIAPQVSLKYELNFGTYKDFSKNKIYTIQNVNVQNFIYQEPNENIDWEILNEYKTIVNYNCRKATAFWKGRKWEVWYTEDIPIQDGPYKFKGLPGLILEVMDSKKDYHFYAKGIRKQYEKIEIPSTFIKISKEKYEKFKEKLIKDPATSTRASVNYNVKMTGSDGKPMSYNDLFDKIIKQFNDFMNSHNNPIEKGTIWIR